jgi:hypothetical protein
MIDIDDVIFKNPKRGGVYKIRLNVRNYSSSYSNIVLPLAGAEVSSIIRDDVIRAGLFAQEIRESYNFIQRQLPTNLFEWFWVEGAGDYRGRADNINSETVRMYNEVAFSGLGSVYTWEGIPIRSAKISNFMVAVGMREIGVISPLGVLANIFGTFPQDDAASRSWDAGWEVGGGTDYDEIVQPLVRDIFWLGDEKNMKLWPNPIPADNYQPGNQWMGDVDNSFTSPGFLYMEVP